MPLTFVSSLSLFKAILIGYIQSEPEIIGTSNNLKFKIEGLPLNRAPA